MQRRQHRARVTGKFADPTTEKTVADIYRALPAGLTKAIVWTDNAGVTHTLTVQNGVISAHTTTG